MSFILDMSEMIDKVSLRSLRLIPIALKHPPICLPRGDH
jgi:hypothetical protein